MPKEENNKNKRDSDGNSQDEDEEIDNLREVEKINILNEDEETEPKEKFDSMVSKYIDADEDRSDSIAKGEAMMDLNQKGKQHLYSKYIDTGVRVVKESRRSFVFEGESQTSSINEAAGLKPVVHHSMILLKHPRDTKKYYIPELTENERHRVGCNKYLGEAAVKFHQIDYRDHITLCMSHFTARRMAFLKMAFQHAALDMKTISKVYLARLMARYHEYGKLFKFSDGRQGMVTSMRFTSHCSDIVRTYIELAALLEDPKEFCKNIMELASRHARLSLKLRDHQVHYRPFAEILGSRSDEPLRISAAILMFVSMISRAILRAETELKNTIPLLQEDNANANVVKFMSVKHKAPTVSTKENRKQPTWD